MKTHKFQVGDIVKHNYDATDSIGEISEVRNHPQGYDYFIRFESDGNPIPTAKDWFKEDVLILVEADNAS